MAGAGLILKRRRAAQFTTTDATPIVVPTLSYTPPDLKSVMLSLQASVRRSSSTDQACYTRQRIVGRNGSALVDGGAHADATTEAAGLAAAEIAFIFTGAPEIRVQLTGIAATLDWMIEVAYIVSP